MKDTKIDELLRHSLTQIIGPDRQLNESIKKQIDEHTIMQKRVKKLIPIPLLIIILTLLMSFSVYAAWKLLSPDEVVQELGDNGLATAFQSENAVVVNEIVTSEGYNISFLGVVSGEELSDFKLPENNIYTNRTYAVVAISKEDGSPMPSTSDKDYNSVNFFVSPLIMGENPWLFNIATMNNGGYTELVINGIMYRLIECDNVEIFADRGLYLCVSSTTFYSVEAYNYNEETGEITPNPEFDGINVLFDLPLDPSKADSKKAEKFLQDLYSNENSDSNLYNSDLDNSDSLDFDVIDIIENGNLADLHAPEILDALMEISILIPESVKEVSYTDEGLMVYEYDGARVVCGEEWIFPEGFIGMSNVRGLSMGENGIRFSRYNRDENGVITGMRYQVQLNDDAE